MWILESPLLTITAWLIIIQPALSIFSNGLLLGQMVLAGPPTAQISSNSAGICLNLSCLWPAIETCPHLLLKSFTFLRAGKTKNSFRSSVSCHRLLLSCQNQSCAFQLYYFYVCYNGSSFILFGTSKVCAGLVII